MRIGSRRRVFTRALFVGMVAALPATAVAADKIEWRLSTFGAPRAVTKGLEEIVRHVGAKSGGNFAIDVGWGEAFSGTKESLDGIKIGAFEVAQFCAAYGPGKVPRQTVLELPFLPIETLEEMRLVHEAFHADPRAVEEMEQWNAKFLFVSLLPGYEFMGAGDPPTSLDSWKGMRVRALGGAGKAMAKLGAVPTTVPAPEVYTGMERGLFRAMSFPFPDGFGVFRIHEVSRWYTQGMAIGLPSCPLIMNKQAYEALPAEYQQLLWDAKPGASDALKKVFAAAVDQWVPVFEERGLVEVPIDDAMMAEFVTVGAKPVWEEWVTEMEAKGQPGQALLDFVLAEAKKAKGS